MILQPSIMCGAVLAPFGALSLLPDVADILGGKRGAVSALVNNAVDLLVWLVIICVVMEVLMQLDAFLKRRRTATEALVERAEKAERELKDLRNWNELRDRLEGVDPYRRD